MTGRTPRVLHVITGLDVGGAESMLAALLTATMATAEQRVACLVSGGAHLQSLRAAGVTVDELGFRRSVPDPRGVWRLTKLVRTHRPDVIQSWMYHADLVALSALSLSGRRQVTRLVWGIRCSDMDVSRYSPLLRATIGLCAALSKQPDAVVANSEAGLAEHKRRGYSPRRAAVIYNGIDTAKFRPDPALRAAVRQELGIPLDARIIAHVARVDAMKDHDTLLASAAKLRDVLVLAVGRGTEHLPERPNIRRLGRRDDVPRLLAASDLALSSSAFGEGFSNSIAEGMAAGLPAVATDVGDARVIIGDTGLVVPPRDPIALASAVRQLLDEPETAHRDRGAQARARIQSLFSLDHAVHRFEALWQDLMAEDAA